MSDSIAGEIEISFNQKDLANGVSFTSKSSRYQDLKFALVLQFGPDNVARFGVKLIDMPKSISAVKFMQIIHIYNGTNRLEVRNDRSIRNNNDIINWSLPEYAGHSNPTPSNMNYNTSLAYSELVSGKKWAHPDGTIRLKVTFSGYTVTHNMDYLMVAIAQFLSTKQNKKSLQNQDKDAVAVEDKDADKDDKVVVAVAENKVNDDVNDDDDDYDGDDDGDDEKLVFRGGELGVLKTLISNLEKENSRLNRANEKLEADVIAKKTEYAAQVAMIDKLQKLNDDSIITIKKAKAEMESLQKKNKVLEENVSNCQFSDALKNFQPENARWEENNVAALKDSIQKIMKVEQILHDKINYQESCQECHKSARQCAMAPCGHLAYCIPCYEQIQKKHLIAVNAVVPVITENETKKQEETPTTETPDQNETMMAEKKPEKPVHTIKCPICTVDVASVIIVKN